MRIVSATARNFGSYEYLTFDFDGQGLSLISGPTGAGKSTLCDLIPWCLYGVTAKNGAADDVLAWNASGNTECSLYLETKSLSLQVFRSRGARKDLWYSIDDLEISRGKDLSDTQKMLDDVLGMSAEVFISSSYYHEFSQTANFFAANAKARREFTENICDLGLPKKLSESLSKYKKYVKDHIEEAKKYDSSMQTKLDTLTSCLKAENKRLEVWEEKAASYEKELEQKRYDWEYKRQMELQEVAHCIADYTGKIGSKEEFEAEIGKIDKNIEQMSEEACKECGSPKKTAQILVLSKDKHRLEQRISRYESGIQNIQLLHKQLQGLKSQKNPHEEDPKQNLAKNPHKETIFSYEKDIKAAVEGKEEARLYLRELGQELADLELLSRTVGDLRSVLIEASIDDIERRTNGFLSEHFDAEIKVAFSSEEADKLAVTIHKDGNTASYQQLSKGQRQILKLCFGVSVMQAISNQHGVTPNCLFFDECLDGMSDDFKEKAFGLLSRLQLDYKSIFVVDHGTEMKERFTNKYLATIENGKSTLCQL